MGGYGVDPATWEPLPWSWAAERLGPNKSYWVVTVSGAGRPHAMPVWGVWDDDEHRFAFSCAPTARKARNIAENAQVVVTVDDTVECVSVEGAAAPVEDDDRRAVIADRYVEKYRSVSPDLQTDFILANLLFEVTPDRAFAVIEREEEFATRATRWVF